MCQDMSDLPGSPLPPQCVMRWDDMAGHVCWCVDVFMYVYRSAHLCTHTQEVRVNVTISPLMNMIVNKMS